METPAIKKTKMQNPSHKPLRRFRLGFKTGVGLALLLLALVGFMGWRWLQPQKPKSADAPTVSARRQALLEVVAATGRVVPNFEVEIKGKASGKIMQLPYDVSDTVPKGALLVQLDPIDESRQVSQSRASLASTDNRTAQAQLNLTVAQRNLQTDLEKAKTDLQAAQIKQQEALAQQKRLETLVKNRYISQQEYEAGLSAAAQAQTSLTNMQIRLQELETQKLALAAQAHEVGMAMADAQGQQVALSISQQRLAETKIYAPIAGVVTSRAGEIGQIIASGISNVSGGTAIMTLADLSRIFVLASVDESDIGKVRVGQAVDITADAFSGKRFQGKVIRISPKGLSEANVVTFEVKIEVVDANKQLLKPEMTANVEIQIHHVQNALTVPLEAVVVKNGHSGLRVLKADGTIERRRVQTGINNGSQVEILQGVAEGEKVLLTSGQEQSRWRQNGRTNQGGGGNSRGQMMMMRGMGRR